MKKLVCSDYIIAIPFRKLLIFSLCLPSLHRYIIIIKIIINKQIVSYVLLPPHHGEILQETNSTLMTIAGRSGLNFLFKRGRLCFATSCCASCRTRLGFEGSVRLCKAKLVTSQVSLSTHHHRWVVPQVS